MKRILSTLAVLIILTFSVFSKVQVSPVNLLYFAAAPTNVWLDIKAAKGDGYNTFAFEDNYDYPGTIDIYGVTDILIDEN